MSWPLSIFLTALVGFVIWFALRINQLTAMERSELRKGPCANGCLLIPIAVRPLEASSNPNPNIAMAPVKQIVLLRRCMRCGGHMAIVYAGEWTIGDFLKNEADEAKLQRMIG